MPDHTTGQPPSSVGQFGAIFSESPDLLLIIDGKSGHILECNPVVTHYLGYNPDDLSGQHFSLLFPSVNDHNHSPNNHHDPTLAPLDQLQIRGNVFMAQPIRHADGSLVPMDLTTTMIATDQGMAILAVLRDARERVQDEAAQQQAHSILENRLEQQESQLWQSQQLLQEEASERKQAEEHVRIFSALAAAASDGIIVFTPDGSILYANPAYRTMVGDDTPAPNGVVFANALEVSDLLSQVIQTTLEQGEWHGIVPFKRRTGATFKGDMATMVIPHQATDSVILAAIIRDITSRVQMEESLRESEERLRHLSSAGPVVIFSCQPSGNFGATFITENIRTVFGYEPHEFLETPQFWANHIHPDDAPRIFAGMQPLFDQGFHEHEYRFLHADGSYRWVENHLKLIYNDEGQPTEIIGSLQDITERKHLEREVLVQKQRLDTFFVSAPAGMVLLDKETRFKNMNEAAATMNGLPIEAHLGKKVFDVLPVFVEALEPVFERVLHQGESLLNIEIESQDPAEPGRLSYWQASYFPIFDSDGGVDGIGIIFIEITERKQAETILQQSKEELERRVNERTAELAHINKLLMQEISERKRAEMELETERALLARKVEEQTRDLRVTNIKLAHAARLKDEFLANMSHELRTPLNAILGLSEALQEEVYGTLTERQRSTIKSIEESGRHLLDLINDILDLSRIESGKTELAVTSIAIESLCRASLRMIKSQAQKKRIKVSESFDSTLTHVPADERRLKQMVVNLLTNAVKFTPEGGRVGLEVGADQDYQMMHITVWDTGIGIAEQDMGRLFKPFEQIDSSLSRQHEGTGLGLALVARLAELHGGSVALESEVGKGSQFTITLPLQRSKPKALDAIPSWHPLAATEAGEAHPARILQRALIIEDSPSAAEQIARYLKELGVETVVYTQGNSAVSKAIATQPDVIILDILLPDLLGWEILSSIKAEPDLQHIPVIISSVVDEQSKAKRLGAEAYIVKPISRQQVQQVLHRVFPQQVANGEEAEDYTISPEKISTTVHPDRPHEAIFDLSDYTEPPLVLLAEDNEENISMVSEYLFARGFRVEIAHNGAESLQLLRWQRPAIILMDIQMPGMDGMEAIRRIRADGTMADIPIIALTALAMAGDRERCLEAGADEYMSKPIRLRELVRLIGSILKQQREAG